MIQPSAETLPYDWYENGVLIGKKGQKLSMMNHRHPSIRKSSFDGLFTGKRMPFQHMLFAVADETRYGNRGRTTCEIERARGWYQRVPVALTPHQFDVFFLCMTSTENLGYPEGLLFDAYKNWLHAQIHKRTYQYPLASIRHLLLFMDRYSYFTLTLKISPECVFEHWCLQSKEEGRQEMIQLMNALGIYPPRSIVQLSDGKEALIEKGGLPHRPRMRDQNTGRPMPFSRVCSNEPASFVSFLG